MQAPESQAPIEWYVLRGEQQSGPYPDDVVIEAYAGGHFEPGDLVWREGFAEWRPADAVLGGGRAGGGQPTNAGVAEASASAASGASSSAASTSAEKQSEGGVGEGEDALASAVASAVERIARGVAEGAAAAAEPVAAAASVAVAEAASAVHAVAAPDAVGPTPAAEIQAFASLEQGHGRAAPRATAPAGTPLWPMPIEDFLSGPYLQRADVVLTRKNRDLKSWLIRWATKGSFSHAALVFLVPHLERGFNNSFVIESASGGVDLTNFRDYVSDRRSVIGIKRLNVPWFTDEVQCAVRGRMLNSIKSTYDYATIIRLARELLADVAFGIKARVYGPSKAIARTHERRIQPPNKFICSGLVQLGFIHSLLDLAAEKRLPPEFLSDIVFREELREFLPEDWSQFTADEQDEILWEFATGFADLLEAVTPEDLATSPKLEWVYVVKRGLVYQAHSDEQARELLVWKPKKRKA